MSSDKSGESLLPSESAGPNTVYEQWHSDLRYYRLYEQAVAFWACTVLLAFAGGAVAYITADSRQSLVLWQRVLLILAPALFAATAAFVVGYVAHRYSQLRDQRKSMEPKWKRCLDHETGVDKLPKILNPTVAQIILIILLGIIASVTIWAATNP